MMVIISKGNRTEWSPIRFVIIQVEKKSHLSMLVRACTIQLLRHDMYYPIKAEIRVVDSQSDLRILLWL